MRHKVVHDYLCVDLDIVWQVVTEDLPPLVVLLEKILATASWTNPQASNLSASGLPLSLMSSELQGIWPEIIMIL